MPSDAESYSRLGSCRGDKTEERTRCCAYAHRRALTTLIWDGQRVARGTTSSPKNSDSVLI